MRGQERRENSSDNQANLSLASQAHMVILKRESKKGKVEGAEYRHYLLLKHNKEVTVRVRGGKAAVCSHLQSSLCEALRAWLCGVGFVTEDREGYEMWSRALLEPLT